MWIARLFERVLTLFKRRPPTSPYSDFLPELEQWIVQHRNELKIGRSSGGDRWNIHLTDFTTVYALCKTLPSVTTCRVKHTAGYDYFVFTLKGGVMAVLSDRKTLRSTRTAILRIYEAGREKARISFL